MNHPREKKPTLSRILRILRDPVWQFVGAITGVIVGVMAILGTYHIFFLQREVKTLQVVVLTSTSLVEIEQSVAEEVKILYRDQPITDLSLFQVKVENSGNQTILEEDYARPIRFVFPSEAEIVEAMVLESSPRNIGMTVRKEQNTATLSSVLLNEEDRIIVRVLVSNMPADSDAQPFYVDARIAGVKETPIVNAIEDRETTKGVSANFDYLSGFLSGFVGAGIMGCVLQKRRVAQVKMGAYKRPQTLVARLRFVFWTAVLAGTLLGFAWLTIQVFLPL